MLAQFILVKQMLGWRVALTLLLKGSLDTYTWDHHNALREVIAAHDLIFVQRKRDGIITPAATNYMLEKNAAFQRYRNRTAFRLVKAIIGAGNPRKLASLIAVPHLGSIGANPKGITHSVWMITSPEAYTPDADSYPELNTIFRDIFVANDAMPYLAQLTGHGKFPITMEIGPHNTTDKYHQRLWERLRSHGAHIQYIGTIR